MRTQHRALADHDTKARLHERGGSRDGDWSAPANRAETDALIRQHYGYLWWLANGRLPHAIRPKVAPEDLVQDTFVHMLDHVDRFTGRTRNEFRAWLRQILLNHLASVVRRYMRAAKRRVAKEVPLVTPDAATGGRQRALAPCLAANLENDPAHIVVRREDVDRLSAAIAVLPERYRQVVLLYGRDAAPFTAIGLQIGRSGEAARKIWTNAKRLLVRSLKSRPLPR